MTLERVYFDKSSTLLQSKLTVFWFRHPYYVTHLKAMGWMGWDLLWVWSCHRFSDFKFQLFPEDIDMTSQLGSISPLRLETVLECEVITDLRRGKSKKRKTGGKKIIGSRHLRTTVKEEVVDHGEGGDDVGAK